MTELNKAVFLSYASQDAEPAARICSSLRAAGIEVWFDQSELRGGDAWEQTIHQQIRECALFLPIISAATQARLEGYFRLEWTLADHRTEMIARSKAFIVPVSVDSTPESGADVPESFLHVQWTRLPRGEVPAGFCERIVRLLSGVGAVGSTAVKSGPAQRLAPPKWRKLWISGAVLGLLMAGASAWQAWRLIAPRTGGGAPAMAVPNVPEKSIAVLPFVDMSKSKDQEYFSDGLAEELLDMLSQVPELKVPARTSSFYFKGKQATIGEIATALNVAHVLEGSVRKEGHTIRVTVQLIRADNGYHLWSHTYDRDMEDVFKVQDEIAAAVVEALKVQLQPAQRVASRRTSDKAAYDQYLLGRQFFYGHANAEDYRRSIQAFHRSIAIDPNYAAAYAGLAISEMVLTDLTGDPAGLKRAADSADKAIELAPDEAEGYAARGYLRTNFSWDWIGAQADFTRARTLNPVDGEVQRRYGGLLGSLGRLPEAIAALKKATVLDPLSNLAWLDLGYYLTYSGDYWAAHEALRRALEIQPDDPYGQYCLGRLQLLEGKGLEAVATFNKLAGTDRTFYLQGVALAEHTLQNAKASQQALDELIAKSAPTAAAQIAEVYAWRGEKDQAFKWLERAYLQRDGGLTDTKSDVFFARLHADPRYQAFLRKMRLPEA